MKNSKLLCLILLSLLLSGCTNNSNDINTIYYNLNIGTSFKEEINIYLTKDAYKLAEENKEQEEGDTNLEYKLLHEDIEPIFSIHDEFYKKDIDKGFNNIKVNLSYTYIEDDFIYSNYLMNCFENYDITNTNDSVAIKLSGEFYCLNDKKNIDIRVNSIFEVKESNGVLDNDAYIWNIDTENANNVNIYHTISRNYDGMIKNRDDIITKSSKGVGWTIIRGFILVIILGLLFILYKKYKNSNDY